MAGQTRRHSEGSSGCRSAPMCPFNGNILTQDGYQIREIKTIGILLAAGKSCRFGPENKLLESFNGRPLCIHAAEAMSDAGLSKCVSVVSDSAVAALLTGFELVRCSGSQSDSLKAGVQTAIALDADQIVVCLADMPFVTAQLIRNLLALAKTHPICASRWGDRISPPAVLPRARFDDLLKLEGDRGAFSLFKKQRETSFLRVEENVLTDLDTISDFLTFGENL